MKTSEEAKQKFINGYNCAQSVFSTIAPDFGITARQAENISRAFGAGISYKAETCGAVTGALMAIGLKIGNRINDEELCKTLTKKHAQAFMHSFTSTNKSLLCKELLEKDLSKPEELELLNNEGKFDKICPEIVKSSTQLLLQTFKTIDNELRELF